MTTNTHPTITAARVEEAARRSMFGTDNPGLCTACGAEVDGCEPDARGYDCEACGEAGTVYGAEELLLAGRYHEEAAPAGSDKPAQRPLWKIARDVRRYWRRKDGSDAINYAARPYLDAMGHLSAVTDFYGCDPAASVVRYFLSNARSWRGPDAKRIKAELRALVGDK